MGLIQKMRRPLRQCHTAEAIRLLLATGLGFCLHLLLEGCRSQNIGDSHCRPCDCGRPLDVAGAPNSQPRERYRPHSIQSVIRFQYFNMTHIHDNFDEDPRTHLLDHQKADIQDILNNAIVLFNTGKPRKFKLNGLVNGYRRVDPLRGEEFILDVQLSPELDLTSHRSDDDNGINRVYHRLELVKPFGISQLVETLHINEETMIHFILPVSLRHLDQLVSFLEVFEDMCLKQKQHVYLMVVLHTGSSDYDQNLETQINLKLRNLHQRYPGSHIRSIRTSRAFSRSSGLELGARQLPGDVLVFFADVDVMFTAEFLTRCRQNAVYGQQVYYPILFGQYNPEVVEMYSPKHELPAHRDEIHRHTGEWLHQNFEVACMYNKDLRSAGGFRDDLRVLGTKEDHITLYDKHVKSKLMIFRAMDPGLIKVFTSPACSSDRSKCAPALNDTYTFASKSQLINKLRHCTEKEKS